uniref:IRF tryptophan pentad repeat domain-containing protein n=1 Tax=Monopterus albus TaxID=43700 RepID=A0A3Q3KFZ6_MONAL
MNPEVDYGGSGSSGNGKLRQWLIDQVDCGKYPGLVWENDERTIFRIPWKHAGKQDYNRDEDAALFKAWALFKGKFREGIDKPDPPTWKTRLRCALNKSNDFEELVERSQLDISDPYKVYRIIPEGAKKSMRIQCMPQYMAPVECGWRDYCQEQASLPELPFTQCPCPTRSLPWQSASIENDFRLHVTIYFRDTVMQEVTTSSPEGCHITPCSPEEKHYLPPGGPEVVPLPVDSLSAQRRADECPPSPPSTLERGVLLWMGADGLYARRLCQSRVYWQGGLSPYGDKPNKLEREVTCKLLHTQDYLTEIQSYGLHGRLLPRFQVLLSFGDECLDPQRQRRTLTVQVEPLFARQLQYYAQQTGSHLYRSYEHPVVTEHINSSEDYQRAITHHHSSSLQE